MVDCFLSAQSFLKSPNLSRCLAETKILASLRENGGFGQDLRQFVN